MAAYLVVGEDVGHAHADVGVGLVPLVAVGVVLDDGLLARGDVAEVVDAGGGDLLHGVRPDGVHEALEDVRRAKDAGLGPRPVDAGVAFVGLIKLGGGGAVVGELAIETEEHGASLSVTLRPINSKTFSLVSRFVAGSPNPRLVDEDVDVGERRSSRT